MLINAETKVIARLHKEANGTGLNIYNPYLQDKDLNTVYLLFQNNIAKPLIDSIRKLSISGAITAGFEHDPILPKLVDKHTEAVKLAKRVGIIINSGGILTAHYQGGEGLLSAIHEKTSIKNKEIVVVGAGTVAKTLLLALESGNQKPKAVYVFNRTKKNAERLRADFNLVKSTGTLSDLGTSKGNILVNVTRIGSAVPDELFNNDLIAKFDTVVDVTFGTESTNLIKSAKKQNIITISGWDMFTHQAAVVLKYILSHNADIKRLRYFVRKGLSVTNHGKKPKK